ncbi:hypothetical protein H0H92_002771 [Tricholoma furcatifolium]|nr:hypothetical protein H0H92_002771 [Tricholoma furcatifolium]
MYWSVLGCIIGVEYLAEWAVSWIPLYYTLKSLFLLYLVLPQTKGASYIYTAHLQPFFHSHETQIDATLASLRAQAYAFIQERFRALWDAAASSLQQQQQPSTSAGTPQPPPTLADPMSGPAQLAATLWRSYGPSVLASGAALLRTVAPTAPAPPRAPATSSSSSTTTSASTPDSAQALLNRRRQLEAELASLESTIPRTQGSTSTSRPASAPGLRERTNSSGKFEEVEVPSDVEGYDLGEGEGHAVPQGQRASWFGWGAGAGGKGYERVKNE